MKKDTEIKNSRLNKLVLEKIISLLPGHVYWKNTQGYYVGCNERQAKSLGLQSAEDVIGKKDIELPWKKEDALYFVQNDNEVMQTRKEKVAKEMAFYEGKEAYVLSQKVPVIDEENNELLGVLGVSIDITDLKKAQKDLKTAYESRIKFIRMVSHEIAGPLGNIAATLDYVLHCLNAGNDLNTLKEEIQEAYLTSKVILPKIKAISDFITFNAEEIKKPVEKGNIVEVIKKIIQDIEKNTTHSNDIEIKLYNELTLSEEFKLDFENLYIVLNIIINNALKFTSEGNISIIIKNEFLNNKEHIIIKIEDTGIGMPKQTIENIFKNYPTNPNLSNSDSYKNANIKLPYCKMLIEEIFHGAIEINSQQGKGTCVILKIPLELSLRNNFSSLQVLLVEDDLDAAEILKKIITKLGHTIKHASDGKMAVRLFQEHSFDVLLLDIGLPDINGIDLLKKLSVLANRDKEIKAVAVTSHYSEDDANHFISSGFIDVLPKPVSIERLKNFFEDLKKIEEI